MTRAEQPSVLVLGEVMRVFVAEPGDSVDRAEGFRSTIGGAEGNVAVGLARQGIPVRWVGRVGDDDAGRYVLRRMRAEGIDLADVLVADSAATGMLIRNTSAHSAISVTYHRAGSAGSRVSAADVVRAWERQRPSLVHVTGITALLSDDALGAVTTLLDRAAGDNVPVSFDVNLRLRLAAPERWRSVLPPVLSRAGIVFAGAGEIEVLAPGRTPAEVAREWLAAGAEAVIVKNEDHTCTAFTARGEFAQPSLVREMRWWPASWPHTSPAQIRRRAWCGGPPPQRSRSSTGRTPRACRPGPSSTPSWPPSEAPPSRCCAERVLRRTGAALNGCCTHQGLCRTTRAPTRSDRHTPGDTVYSWQTKERAVAQRMIGIVRTPDLASAITATSTLVTAGLQSVEIS